MLNDLRTFWRQVKKHRNGDLCSSPFSYYARWKSSLKEGASSVNDRQPWIAFETIDFLEKHIGPSSRVFEYGGGGSTLFFLDRAGEVATVEHDGEWFNVLKSKAGSSKWKGAYIGAEPADTKGLDMSEPRHYFSEDYRFTDKTFKAYASAIDQYPEGYFDCVVVDGRVRPSCMLHAMPKIKKGGCLVLDNSEREYYLAKMKALLAPSFECVFNHFGPTPYSREFTKSGVWRKTV